MFYEKFYLRHSAFRTINGGICLGLSPFRPALAQLLLLEYQRMVNNSIFKGILSFLSLPNIADLSCGSHFMGVENTASCSLVGTSNGLNTPITSPPPSYRQIWPVTFANCIRQNTKPSLRHAYILWILVYAAARRQLKGSLVSGARPSTLSFALSCTCQSGRLRR
jgi:hypothetical protein